LSPRQNAMLDTLLPKLAVTIPDAPDAPIDIDALFARKDAPLWLEIGFGKGEHIATQAKWNPEVNLIGCEPFINGVVGLLYIIADEKQENIRIYPDDARDVLEHLPDASVERTFLLHPDPWPKTKHEKRRFVSQENLASLARVMKDGAELRIGTDHSNYARWTMLQLDRSPFFQWNATSADQWRIRPDDWPETRYQQKALKDGVSSVYLSFNRVSR
ncbi:MAG: tRNA (guanosine(46)-N7)-methyltransferase TrmB, partial [Sphingomonadales bacterium]|nr:tRNA (guanosine(46)-N7)-methyltransferase TrmB [Sphingomonadales bacterium]